MGIQDFIAIAIAAVAAGYAFRAIWRNMNDGGCTSGRCGQGSIDDRRLTGEPAGTHSKSQDTSPNGVIRRPMVTLDQVGLPNRDNSSTDVQSPVQS